MVYFAAAIIGFISAIVIPIEAYRPWSELFDLIEKAQTLVGTIDALLVPEDIAKINRFALDTIPQVQNIDETDKFYYNLAYNMLVSEKKILPSEEIVGKLEDLEGEFNYEKLMNAKNYWESRFQSEPEILNIFHKYWHIIRNARKNVRASGFKITSIVLMLDSGKKHGFFQNNIAYLLESSPWWYDVPHCGGSFEINAENEFWRKSALNKKNEYGNNSIVSPKNWYMPGFDEDEWGTWFSVWLTKEANGVYNIFNIDFDASSVKKAMLIVASSVGSAILILAIIVIFITKWLSNMVTRPITELTKGAEQVAGGNYEYEVPIVKEDEFGDLTRQFNLMTHGQKERLNLMETMEKFLGKELAEMAAEKGLVLGGKEANCTIMFTDFAGFSTITQKMPPDDVVSNLNSYFSELIPIVKRYGGFPDKYIGDAIVAFFGAPITLEDHAERAVACGIEMQWKIREMNEKRIKEGKTVFEMRVGLNSGDVLVGAIGCDMKLEYTSIGETTNLANRMESICKIGHVMMAEGTYFQIKDIFFKGVDIAVTPKRVAVKGYPEPVATYGIYVTEFWIEKDMKSEDPSKFYIYQQTERKLKANPKEVKNISFIRQSKFL